ncbi:hypothetical protein R1flu_013092 [Riccia fluitans]|uniref:Serine aminopeptidase S33 domain-containing protein n=1 Tax=Riccia fluitans TaxID=41844 RepID=A0ABD1ZCM8_9MARC
MPHPVVDANVDSIFGKYSPEEFYTRHGVVHSEAFMKNSSGLSLYTHSWKPLEGTAKGLVFICHGYGSDSGWLVQLTAIGFAERGYSVHAIDHQGHGKSGGLKGYIPSLDAVTDDCIQFFDSVRNAEENSGLRSFLYGESMGGAIVLLITLRQPNNFSGVMLNGAMLMISDKYKPPWPLESILKFVAPFIHRLPIVPTKDIPTISFREEWKRTLALANPRRYAGRPRAGTAAELLRIVRVMEQRLQDVAVPFIAVHGQLDTVVDPAGSEALFEKASSVDKTVKVYKGMWHQLVGEPAENVEEVFGTIFSWLDTHAVESPA